MLKALQDKVDELERQIEANKNDIAALSKMNNSTPDILAIIQQPLIEMKNKQTQLEEKMKKYVTSFNSTITKVISPSQRRALISNSNLYGIYKYITPEFIQYFLASGIPLSYRCIELPQHLKERLRNIEEMITSGLLTTDLWKTIDILQNEVKALELFAVTEFFGVSSKLLKSSTLPNIYWRITNNLSMNPSDFDMSTQDEIEQFNRITAIIAEMIKNGAALMNILDCIKLNANGNPKQTNVGTPLQLSLSPPLLINANSALTPQSASPQPPWGSSQNPQPQQSPTGQQQPTWGGAQSNQPQPTLTGQPPQRITTQSNHPLPPQLGVDSTIQQLPLWGMTQNNQSQPSPTGQLQPLFGGAQNNNQPQQPPRGGGQTGQLPPNPPNSSQLLSWGSAPYNNQQHLTPLRSPPVHQPQGGTYQNNQSQPAPPGHQQPLWGGAQNNKQQQLPQLGFGQTGQQQPPWVTTPNNQSQPPPTGQLQPPFGGAQNINQPQQPPRGGDQTGQLQPPQPNSSQQLSWGASPYNNQQLLTPGGIQPDHQPRGGTTPNNQSQPPPTGQLQPLFGGAQNLNQPQQPPREGEQTGQLQPPQPNSSQQLPWGTTQHNNQPPHSQTGPQQSQWGTPPPNHPLPSQPGQAQPLWGAAPYNQPQHTPTGVVQANKDSMLILNLNHLNRISPIYVRGIPVLPLTKEAAELLKLLTTSR
jgi:hypothetical protein